MTLDDLEFKPVHSVSMLMGYRAHIHLKDGTWLEVFTPNHKTYGVFVQPEKETRTLQDCIRAWTRVEALVVNCLIQEILDGQSSE